MVSPVLRETLIDAFVLAIELLIALVIQVTLTPYQKAFSLNDPLIQYTTKSDSVSNVSLFVISIGLPIFIFGTFNCIPLSDRQQSWKRFTHRSFGLLQSFGLTLVITNIIKFTYGGLRPDFLARCLPDINLICTGSASVIQEGRLSFPSGHASISCSGLVYLSLFLFFELGLAAPPFRQEQSEPTRNPMVFLKLSVTLCPVIGAILIGISRVVDHRHHPYDGVWGLLLGTVIAILVVYVHHYQPFGQAYDGWKRSRIIRTSSQDLKDIDLSQKSSILEQV
jgi:membrane-associated phospholipid phosphatase